MDWGPILTVSVPIVGAGIMGLVVWSVQRIVKRIDSIGDRLVDLSERVTVIETKQDLQVEAAVRTDRVTRQTAAQVGVQLPRELSDTIDPTRRTPRASRRPAHG